MTKQETMEAWKLARAKGASAAALGLGQYDPKTKGLALEHAYREAAVSWLVALNTAAKWAVAAPGWDKVDAARTMGKIAEEWELIAWDDTTY